jgi:hydrogenase maturation protein HypF
LSFVIEEIPVDPNFFNDQCLLNCYWCCFLLSGGLMATRTQILVRGIVQGVGFRPYVFSLAQQRVLRGRVFNNSSGVVIEVEGGAQAIEQFVNDLTNCPPPLALIESVERSDDLTPANFGDFRIIESAVAAEKVVPIPADIATCADCLRELFDPRDRRYRYPFINCTNCGPRFTIIQEMPYDRARTTMREFVMCDECRAEYEDPLDRRFHAEPIACHACGPQLLLTDVRGREVTLPTVAGAGVLSYTRWLLGQGRVIAIKGLGGYHLACDALNTEAVECLRRGKYREDKPFALMAGSIDLIREYCVVTQAEEESLLSVRRPVVLLERKSGANIPRAVAPGVRTLGFMLPYTPLHHLLLEGLGRPLVMTSGNVSDEPICYEDGEAKRRLGEIADYFLWHNRRIQMRVDDSVVRVQAGSETFLRRSRGYAPMPLKTSLNFHRQILACGAEMKNAFCLTRDNYAFISHHIGDLENLETFGALTAGIEHFKRLFDLQPDVIAHDLHPEYLSTKYALSLPAHLLKIGVQHHHAHIASCLADNELDGDVIGVAFDGLGYGEDGRLWGGEFFVADYASARRIAHLSYVPMPGGSQAIREPWRMAAVYLHRAFGDEFLHSGLPFVQRLNRRAWPTLKQMAARGINCPETSSVGRLFDAVASLLGVRDAVNYEGQAAIELEAIAVYEDAHGYQFEFDESRGIVEAAPVIRQIVGDLLFGVPAEAVSARFHLGVAQMIEYVACRVREQQRLDRVALSGGVFQNKLLLEKTRQLLSASGFQVFTHRRVPPGDGGIALGQAAVANARLASGGLLSERM